MIKGFDKRLTCAYDSDLEKMKKIKPGVVVEVSVTKKRNIMFHRKSFALFNLVFSNQEAYANLEDLRHDLTVEAGYYNTHVNLDGEVVKTAKSISFSSMDEHEFSAYYDAIIKVVVKYFGFDREAMIEEIARYF